MENRRRKVTYFHEPDMSEFSYGKEHPMQPKRLAMTHNLVSSYGLHKHMTIRRPLRADITDLAVFHDVEYLKFLSSVEDKKEPSEDDVKRFIDDSLDCPLFPGTLEFSQFSTGGSVGAAVALNKGDAEITINWSGGLHHAKKAKAAGFCYINDIVLAILELLKAYQRVLYIDIDVHHGDGVQNAFYTTDRVMTVSFHKYDGEFFPKTGYLHEVGENCGEYYSVNVPLKDGITDDQFSHLFESIINEVRNVYQPNAIVLQCGADSLYGDTLGTFNLSTIGHANCVRVLKSFDVPLMLLGGGGYVPSNVARCWCYETSVAVGVELDNELPYNDYYTVYGPNPTLLVEPPKDMTNENSQTELDEILITLLQQISKVNIAPSVPLHTPPPFTNELEEDEEDLDSRRHKRRM